MHPADRRQVSEGERFLDYLPRTIYVQFENCEWRVESTLEPGVFPLYPVERTWVLNNESGVKVVRKGYTLVPDYALYRTRRHSLGLV